MTAEERENNQKAFDNFWKAFKALPGEKIYCPICNEEVVVDEKDESIMLKIQDGYLLNNNLIAHILKNKSGEHHPNAIYIATACFSGVLDEYKTDLQKEKEKSLRLQADYQNLEKQTIGRINTSGDKIILDFLTVYEDFIRTKDAYEKEGGNVDNLNSIIKNMESILGNYDVKPIEAAGKKFDPKLHEVVQEIEDNDHEEGTIVKEIAKGYIIRNEIMKYSKVCVSKKIIKE